MYMNKYFISLIIFLLTSSIPVALAHENNKTENNNNKQQKNIVDIKVKNEIETEQEDENEQENENLNIKEHVEVNKNRFEVKGKITSVTDSTFIVAGQTITIDPAMVNQFKQKGVLQIGSFVKVEGKVVNGTKFAQEIRVESSTQTTITPSITTTPEPTTSLTPTLSPTTTQTIELKARGPIKELTTLLNQILSLLKNITQAI